ncbi:MAG: hypothetical protein ABI664_22030 [bacterium]
MTAKGVRLLGTLVATLVVIGAPAALGAQQPVTKLEKPAKMCGGPLALILVTVVDSKGAPVTDAKVDVKRQRDGKELTGTMTDMSPSGEYVVMDDAALPLVPAAGTLFIVRASRGRQAASIVLRIGRTPNGCHVMRLGDESKLVLGR